MKAYTLYAVNVDVDTVGEDVFIDQVSDLTTNPGIVQNLLGGDGAVDPKYLSVLAQQCRLMFSTTALATVLAKNSSKFLINGLDIDTDGGADGVSFWYQKMQDGGSRATGAVHEKMVVKKGLLLPRGLQVAQGGNAALALECVPTYDLTNNPIVLSQADVTGTPNVDEVFTLGPCNINGSALDNTQSLNLAPSIAEVLLGGDGHIWNKFVAIGERRPVARIRTTDVSVLRTYSLTGTAIDANNVVLYLRKRAQGSTLVSDATEEHIKMTIYDGMIFADQIQSTHPGPAMAELLIVGRKGSNDIVSVDTTSAIT